MTSSLTETARRLTHRRSGIRLAIEEATHKGKTAGSPLVAQQDEGHNTGTNPINFTYGTQFRYVNSFPLMVTGKTRKK